MAYPYYNNPYQPNVQAPMDRLQQLQQPYQVQQFQQVPQMQMQPQAQPNNSILWVQGESAAKAYLVAPGTSVLLMDSDSSNFYIKTVDNAGMPLPLRVFRYEEVGQNMPQNSPQAPRMPEPDMDSKYVTRQEYDDLRGKYDAIMNRLASIQTDKKAEPRTRTKGGNADE